jgi:sugar phosphate isomerase/epimerase
MDTAFRRPGLDTAGQLDLVKELGYAGIAWTETAPEKAAEVAEMCAKRGLAMHAIYCAAGVTAEGNLTHSPKLTDLMHALKGRGTIIWLHIGGKGPDFAALTGKEPLFAKLRELAEAAEAEGLTVAVYPHVGEWTARTADAVKVARLVDRKSFGVTFNLCHALAMGEEERIPALLEEAAPVLKTVTVCGSESGMRKPDWSRLIQPLGRGSYDVSVVLNTLRRTGFAGPVGFQGYGIKSDARSILAPTMEAWKGLFATR